MSPDSDKPLRVIFVEDAFDQALLVKAFLSGEGGYDVTHSQDGDHAVQLIQDEEWDMVITDLNLPGTDGFEVIRVARAKSETLPILATTGYTGAEYHDQALRAGANDVLMKPLDKDDFLTTVAVLMGGAAAPSGPTDSILAVGGLAGDVEMGCGGALVQAAAAGRTVVVLPLCRDDLDEGGKGLKASKNACDLLGLRLVIDEGALDDTQRRVAIMQKAVAELRPSLAYIPAMDDTHPARMEAFRVAKSATEGVPTVLAYQTGTTGLDYHPTHFVDVEEHLVLKMEALGNFQTSSGGRVDLDPTLAQAYARYWGRLERFTQVEAFEVIKGTPSSPAS